MKNTLGDLNNHLFEALERLNDMDLKGEELQREIERGNAMSKLASQIVANASLVLKAQTAYADTMAVGSKPPKMLEA